MKMVSDINMLMWPARYRRRVIIFALFVSFLTVITCGAEAAEPAEAATSIQESRAALAGLHAGGEIFMGGLWDMSGPGSMVGQAALKGARLAVHELNRQGGIRGHHIKLAAADTSGDPGTLLQGAARMVNRENCTVIIGPGHAALARTLRGFAEAHRTPLVLTAGDEPVLPLRGHSVDWTFSVSPPITAQIKRLFPRLKRKGAVPVGIVASDDTIGQRTVLWIKGYAQEYQILAGEMQGFDNRDTDIISQIKALRGAGASTVFIWGRSGVARMIADSIRKLPGRYALPCIMLDDSVLSTVQAGITVIAAVPPVLMREALPDAHGCSLSLRRFLAVMSGDIEYMSLRELLAAGAAWDAVYLAGMALRHGGKGKSAVRNALEKAGLEYSGVMGLFRPTRRDHCGLVPASLTTAVLSGYGWRPF